MEIHSAATRHNARSSMISYRAFLLPVWLCIACCNYFFPNLLCIGMATLGLIEMPSLSCVKGCRLKTEGPSSCLSAIFSLCCNYFFPGGLALCNHEQNLGGPNAAQFGAKLGFTHFVCRAVFYKLLRLGCTSLAFPSSLAMMFQTSSGQPFSKKCA